MIGQGESSSPLSNPRDTAAAHGTAVRCPLPGKCPLMQAWRPLAGFIAQKYGAPAGSSAGSTVLFHNSTISFYALCSRTVTPQIPVPTVS